MPWLVMAVQGGFDALWLTVDAPEACQAASSFFARGTFLFWPSNVRFTPRGRRAGSGSAGASQAVTVSLPLLSRRVPALPSPAPAGSRGAAVASADRRPVSRSRCALLAAGFSDHDSATSGDDDSAG